MIEHDVAELLPFYANGTLDEAERARVEAELASCESCAAELRELRALGTSLKSRAADAPALSPQVLEKTLARIAPASAASAMTRIRTAWWGAPARYATAAALVIGFGAAAVAAYHQHEADLAHESAGTAVLMRADHGTAIYPTPGLSNPGAPPQVVARQKISTAQRAQSVAAESALTVVKPHRLAKKARLDLLVRVRDVEGALKQSQSIVHAIGGDVTTLADENPRTTETVHTASLTVEVPADRLDGTLDRLATLGRVQNRAIDAEDLDATIVDQEARLRNLRREENDLRALMDKGGKVTDILTVQDHLSDIRGQIERLDAEHRHNLHRVATSTIDVTISEDRPNPTPVKPGPSARIDGAWHSGLNALADTAVALLSTLAWCVAYAPIPLGLAALAYGATRLLRKRAAAA